MALVKAKCTECGAKIEVDETKKAGVCAYCGNAFVISDAINNYSITNNINAEVVNIINQKEDFVIVGGVLTKYQGKETVIKIPDGVVEIGGNEENNKGAFEGSGITEVILPDTIECIGECAFKNCKRLKKINFPDSLKEIKQRAFESCHNLKSLIIPKSVDIVEYEAFYDCIGLKSLDIYANLISDKAFVFCDGIETLTLGSEKILTRAFYKCYGIKKVIIKKTVKYIASQAFDECFNITEVDYEDYNTCFDIKYGSEYSCYPTNIANSKNAVKIYDNGKQIQKIYIPNGVEYVPNCFFKNVLLDNEILVPKTYKGCCPKCNGYISIFKKCKQCGLKIKKY